MNNVYVECICSHMVITCFDLSLLVNGNVHYGGAGSPGSRPVDTVVTYNCNTGFTLTGGSTRTFGVMECGVDQIQLVSVRKCVCLLYESISIQKSRALIYSHRLIMELFPIMVDPLTSDLSTP